MNITVHEAAKILNVSTKSIYRWIKQGKLPAYHIQDQYRLNRAELTEWATANRVEISPSVLIEPESLTQELPSLSQALEVGGISYRVEGTHRDEVLRSVVHGIPLPEGVDREFLYEVLRTREELTSTGIGDGIAIPHARNPIVLHVDRPLVSLCFLENPVDFYAVDGKPVHTLFVLVSPTVRAHLHILSRLSFALRDPQLRACLVRQGTRAEIYRELARSEAAMLSSAGN